MKVASAGTILNFSDSEQNDITILSSAAVLFGA